VTQRAFVFVLVFLSLLSGVVLSEGSRTLRLKEELIAIQNSEPLTLAKFLACSEVKGYGDYVPLEEAKVKGDGVILFYYEPLNYFTRREGDIYEIWLLQDVVVLDAKQKEVFRQEGTMEIHLRKRSPVLDLYAVNRLTLHGLPPGKYVFRLVLRDKLKGERASFDLPFEVVGGGP